MFGCCARRCIFFTKCLTCDDHGQTRVNTLLYMLLNIHISKTLCARHIRSLLVQDAKFGACALPRHGLRNARGHRAARAPDALVMGSAGPFAAGAFFSYHVHALLDPITVVVAE